MKKRKELNALIGLGDSKRKKPKKSSGHRLLRTEPHDSESESSSEDDGFSGLSGAASFSKRSYRQCCTLCYPLFLFIILAGCVMACAGLIWMQIALKDDLDSLKEKLRSMETSQKASSSEIPKLSEELKNNERRLDDVENGARGLNKLWSNLTELNRKLVLMDSAVTHLKANLKSASDLISLPTTVEELQKSVATIGSTLTSVQHDVKTMQEAVDKQDQDSRKTTYVSDLRKALSEANRTEEQHHTWTDEQIHVLLSTVAELHQRVSLLESSGRTHGDAAHQSPNISTKAPTQEGSDVSRTPTELPRSRRPRLINKRRSKRSVMAGCPQTLRLRGVASLKDLELIFQQNSPGLTSADLVLTLGSRARVGQAVACFDRDQDQRLSLTELRDALGL
ncbi:EF-hand calcium-binding domain-containing protein 14 [Gouania willdenowi]|uniref:EF-hand calcium-binding domain-containing protein 14 n=1 Tax=Gouania willdenowi TaxID=441366 RepID=UPI0010557EEE|nr:EF-hand calcium-binding domain-containing protein 14 [Gouania willdenowi]